MRISSRRVFIDALAAAAARGVKVTVLTNSPASNDIEQVATMSRYAYRQLLRSDDAGAQIHEWRGPAAGEGTLHAKVALFDDREAIIGSYNLDPRSERLNSETAVVIRDTAMVAAMAAELRAQIETKADRIRWAQAAAFASPKDLHDRFKLMFSMPLKGWL